MKEYFEKNDLNPKAAWAGAWRMTLVFGVAFYCLFLMNNLTSLLGLDAWPVKVTSTSRSLRLFVLTADDYLQPFR